jgi:GT2 family glycosyltransferase
VELSIVIVNYNVKHFLQQCLSSVFACDLAPDTYEVWVVDNHSIDGSVEMIEATYPQVNLIANKENLGFGRANNQAINQAHGKYILLLNPDTVVAEDTFSTCIRHLDQDPQVGALGAKMLDGSGQILPESKRGLPTVWNSFCKLTGLDALFDQTAFFNGYNLRHLDPDVNHFVDVLCGAFMMMHKSVLEEIGAFDERFFMYAEDIDLSYRIRQAGYKILYAADTQIIHYKGESSKKGSLSYVKIFYEAMILYVQKHYSGVYGSLFVAALKLAIIARGALTFLRFGIKATLAPVLNLITMTVIGWLIKQSWASWRYDDQAFFDTSPINETIVGAALIIVTALALGQAYRPSTSYRRNVVFTMIGAAVVLITYGLLPEAFRSSRAVVTFLSIAAVVVLPLLNVVLSRILHREDDSNILIVGEPKNADEISNLLSKQPNCKVVDSINPSIDIGQLQEVIGVMRINEVVFSRLDMSMSQIMQVMSSVGSRVRYRLAGDDLLAVVGSKSRNHQGEIYTVDITIRLGQEEYRKTKWAFDKLLSIVALLLSPICWPLHRLSGSYWSDVMATIRGDMTWVGYDNPDGSLPTIKPYVTSILIADMSALDYAKAYRLSFDLLPFLKHIFFISK